jgi:hypothetical protein
MIARDVKSLKTNLDAIEEKAREDLGMIKDGEVFYLVTDKNSRVLKESEISEEPVNDNVDPKVMGDCSCGGHWSAIFRWSPETVSPASR